VLDNAFAYQWKYATVLTNMPMGGSGYIYTMDEVPFLSIATSGKIPVYAEYTNFQANQSDFLLKLIETGAYPSFLITAQDPELLQDTDSAEIYSSKYELYKDQILEYSAILSDLHNKTQNASIIRHEKSGNIVNVTYDNGVVVTVNYSDGTWGVK